MTTLNFIKSLNDLEFADWLSSLTKDDRKMLKHLKFAMKLELHVLTARLERYDAASMRYDDQKISLRKQSTIGAIDKLNARFEETQLKLFEFQESQRMRLNALQLDQLDQFQTKITHYSVEKLSGSVFVKIKKQQVAAMVQIELLSRQKHLDGISEEEIDNVCKLQKLARSDLAYWNGMLFRVEEQLWDLAIHELAPLPRSLRTATINFKQDLSTLLGETQSNKQELLEQLVSEYQGLAETNNVNLRHIARHLTQTLAGSAEEKHLQKKYDALNQNEIHLKICLRYIHIQLTNRLIFANANIAPSSVSAVACVQETHIHSNAEDTGHAEELAPLSTAFSHKANLVDTLFSSIPQRRPPTPMFNRHTSEDHCETIRPPFK